MEKKTTITLWISPSEEPQGGIYRHQEKGGRGDKPWPKALARPHEHGLGIATVRERRYAHRLLCAIALVPCQLYLLDFEFKHPDLTKSPSKVNGYLIGL